MIMKQCNHAGCKTLVPFNVAYCDKHKRPQLTKYEAHAHYEHRKAVGGRYAAFYKSKAWEDLSYSYRLRNPLCVRCAARGLYVKADVVDHITPIRVDWSRRLDESNLQGLCNSCHWQKSEEDRRKYDLPPLATPDEQGGHGQKT